MKYGLTEATIRTIQDVFARYPQVAKAVLYGSRAKGTYKNGSDIDLTLYGGSDLTPNILYKIAGDLDDLLIPYKIDLSIFHDIGDADVLEHIQRVGVTFYDKRGSVMKEMDWLELWRELVLRSSRTKKENKLVERYRVHSRKQAKRPDPLLRFVLEETDPEDTALEIGPGTGRWTIPLAGKIKSVTAVEPTSGMADMLKANIEQAGLGNVHIIPQTWEEASPEIHDIVVCSHGMYGSSDLEAFVRKMEHSSRKRCCLALRLPPADGILAELSLKITGCRHDSPDAVVAYNGLYTLGIYANVLVETGMAHWVNESLDDAFSRAKRHLRLGPSETADYDDLIRSTLNRRLDFSNGVYTWPDGMRSALLWWEPQSIRISNSFMKEDKS